MIRGVRRSDWKKRGGGGGRDPQKGGKNFGRFEEERRNRELSRGDREARVEIGGGAVQFFG